MHLYCDLTLAHYQLKRSNLFYIISHTGVVIYPLKNLKYHSITNKITLFFWESYSVFLAIIIYFQITYYLVLIHCK